MKYECLDWSSVFESYESKNLKFCTVCFVLSDIVGYDAHCRDMRSGGKKKYLFMAFLAVIGI